MTINKLTDNVQPLDMIAAVNELIDSSSSGGASIDLDNLSVTGEAHFQAPLVSGSTIKTINNESVLGSGNISIGGGSATDVQINGTSVTSNNVANIVTNTAYNANSNKIATMSDVPSEVTETTVSNWGFTKNAGTVISVNNTSPDSNGNVTISTGDTLPSQSGNSGKFLTTNGSATSWATVSGGATYTNGTGISITANNVINHSNSVTAGTAGTSSATSGSSLSVPYVTYDSQGHITETGTHTHTVSGFSTTDTKYTAGSSNSTSKLYLVGATAQGTAASNAQAKTTYSNSAVYTQNGYLYATTPTSSQNDTTVATTAFVKAQGYITSALTSVSYNSSTQTLTIS